MKQLKFDYALVMRFSWPTTHNPEVSASESGLSAQNYGAI